MEYYTRTEAAKKLGISPQGLGKKLIREGKISRCSKSGNKILIPGDVMDELLAESGIPTNGNQTETETSETETSETKTETSETDETETETETSETETSETKTETSETDEENHPDSIPWVVYEDLRAQLKIKDEQIKDLSKALLSAEDSLKAAQLLHGADKQEKLLPQTVENEVETKHNEPDQEPEKKGFWARLFGL